MKNPQPGPEAGTENIVARLTCVRCNATVTPLVYPSGPHLRADCPHCRRCLCFVPRRDPWLALLATPPTTDTPLFGGGA